MPDGAYTRLSITSNATVASRPPWMGSAILRKYASIIAVDLI